MSASLSMIWVFINGLQIFMNFPTLNLNVPGVAFIVVEYLIIICNFDIGFGYLTMEMFGDSFKLPKKDVILGDIE